jgi:hypothetical protein
LTESDQSAASTDALTKTAEYLAQIAADPREPAEIRQAHARAARALFWAAPGRPAKTADDADIEEARNLLAIGAVRSIRQGFAMVARKYGREKHAIKRLEKKYRQAKKDGAK